MLLPQDEFLNTKFLALKNGTFERGNFHAVSGGIIPSSFLSTIKKLWKYSFLTWILSTKKSGHILFF